MPAATAVPGGKRTRAVTAGATSRFYDPENYRIDESVAYLMRGVLDNVVAEVEQLLAPSGLTHAQWVPLFRLSLRKSSTAAGLARECRLDAGAMTRMLDRLEAKGLVERARSSEDRRVVNLALTRQGRAAARIIPGALCEVHNRHLDGFTTEEWDQLKSLLRRMLANGLAAQATKVGAP
jgi:DNA-binding MarR family transcriptional regulator